MKTNINWSNKFLCTDTEEIVTIEEVYNTFAQDVLDADFTEEYGEFAEENNYTLFDVYLLQEVSAMNLTEI